MVEPYNNIVIFTEESVLAGMLVAKATVAAAVVVETAVDVDVVVGWIQGQISALEKHPPSPDALVLHLDSCFDPFLDSHSCSYFYSCPCSYYGCD